MVDMDVSQAADGGTPDHARVDPALLDRLAARQAGHLAVWQLVMLGVARSSVTELVSRRGWTRVHRGVLRVLGGRADDMGQLWAGLLCVAGVGGPERATSRLLEGGDRVAALAAAVSDVAVVTGFSAGWLMGIRDNPPAVPQLLVERETQVRGRPVRVVRSRRASDDLRWIDGVPCALPHRVLWDMAWIARRTGRAEVNVADAAVHLDRLRVLSMDEFLGAVADPLSFGLPRRVPRAMVGAADRVRPGFSHSETEARGRAIIREVLAELGLDATPRPYLLRDGAGAMVGEMDVAVIDVQWGLEVDGPHHDAPSVAQRDRRRDEQVRGVDGWEVTRYHHTLVEEEATFRRRVRTDALDMLTRRGWSRAA